MPGGTASGLSSLLRLLVSIAVLTAFSVAFAASADQEESDSAQADDPREEQETPQEIDHEERMEVVASPVIEGNEVDRYGNQTTTVTRRQIADLDAQDPQSALRRVPGVVISRHNPIGSFGGGEGGAIYLRGKGSSRPGSEILTLVDGVPLFVGVWTHPLMDALSIDTVGHIDIYKGTPAVLFGNMAFGAVNLVPKRRTEDGNGGRVNLAAGSYGTAVGAAEYGGRHESFDYYLVGSYRRSDGHRDNADGNLGAFSGRVGQRLSRAWEAGLYLSRTDSEATDPGPEDGSRPPDGTYTVNDGLGILKFSNRYERTSGDIRLYWNQGEIDWIGQFDDDTGTNDADTITDYTNFGIRARQTLAPWSGGEIVAGIDWDTIGGEVEFRSDGTTTSRFEKTEFQISSPYVALSQEVSLSGAWKLTPSAGVRYLAHSEFDDEPAWQAGLVAKHDRIEVHAAYSRSANFPGIYVVVQDEQFLPGENGWRNLEAETIDHVEVGVSGTAGKVHADLTVYQDKVRNRIVVVPPPPFPPILDNVEDYRLDGVEATATWMPSNSVSFFGGVNRLEADRPVPYAPEWTGTLGLNLRAARRVPISLDAQYVDDQLVGSWGRVDGFAEYEPVDSYFLVNARVGYVIDGPGKTATEIYAFVENLTDTSYEMKAGYPMPGINGRLGVIFRF